jgi:DNA-binding transcriptional MerR regulator
MSSTIKRRLAIAPSSPEPRDAAPGLLQVGDLAKSTGKTVRAIHLYEALGLIEPQERSKGHYRLFSPDAEVRVRWISKLQSLGLKLSDIQRLVEDRGAKPSAVDAAQVLKGVYQEKLSDVRSKLFELKALESELEASLSYLEACHSSCEVEVETHSCASCSRHHETPERPDLVVGALLK